jgi:cytochrome bd-type quinol oxidase subunit 2
VIIRSRLQKEGKKVNINNWPPLLYFSILVVIIAGLAFYTIRGLFRREPLENSVMGISLILSGLCAGIQKALRTYWDTFGNTADTIGIAMLILAAIGMMFGFIGVYKYGDEKRKKNAKWFLVYLSAVAIFIGLLFLLKHMGYIGPGK